MEVLSSVLSLLSTHWVGTLVICLVILFCYWGIAPYRRSAIVAQVGDLPGPPPLPFFGNSLDLFRYKGQMHLQFDDYYKKYGRLYTTFLASRKPSIVISDLGMVKELMVKEFQSFHDRPSAVKLPKPLNSMMTSVTGQTWHRIRTTLSPTFSGHKMKVMVPLLNKSCDVLVKKLQDAEKSDQSVNVYKFLQGLTIEAILSSFFGLESNAQTDENDVGYVAAKNAMQRSPFLRRILIFVSLSLPGGKYILTLPIFDRMIMGNFLKLVDLSKDIIKVKKEAAANGNASKDFLDMMLENTDDTNLPEEKRLTEDEVLAQSAIFLLAGFENTSNSLSLVCHHLATNPDIQEKAQEEIDSIWSDMDQPLSYDMVNSMNYLEMIISETLRLHPPVVIHTREATKDCTIKGFPIKKGTGILVPVYSIQRDPEYYDNPDKFDPEHFSAEAKQSRDPYAYMPFGHGPRNCIGMRYVLFQMKMFLARILKQFSLVVGPETKVPLEVQMRTVLGCGKDGIQLRLKCRH
ncbi:cytochrome P450 3A24 [Exaiptasia diaphana]|uniref:Cytochrome P450 n=1 Tax=Exaiptasia diaphana TaxID=2652724 RepID=A0A913XL95_EXADI|nr:cytochrome P450 3A24 [Exaiptasia diaphana]KXJ25668.1 Cytochrome P450 3A24 [Exaiptasia diaphana]